MNPTPTMTAAEPAIPADVLEVIVSALTNTLIADFEKNPPASLVVAAVNPEPMRIAA